jgi:hypothetical protein
MGPCGVSCGVAATAVEAVEVIGLPFAVSVPMRCTVRTVRRTCFHVELYIYWYSMYVFLSACMVPVGTWYWYVLVRSTGEFHRLSGCSEKAHKILFPLTQFATMQKTTTFCGF